MQEMVNVHAAKTNFSRLLARVANGEEIVIAKGGVPVARLVPYGSGPQPRPLGIFAGEMWVSDEAFETPAWLIDAFEGVGDTLPFPSSLPADNAAKGARVAEAQRPAPPAARKRRKR